MQHIYYKMKEVINYKWQQKEVPISILNLAVLLELKLTEKNSQKEQFSLWENLRAGQIYFYAPDRARKKTGVHHQTQCAALTEKQLETTIFVLYYLNSACSINFYGNFIKRFCNEAFALWILFECLNKTS